MLGSLISAGTSILGGLLGSSEKSKDRKMQKEFAQSGIQWKVEDAKKAGVHPLYALGANTHSFAPVSTGGDIGTGIAAAGQDISRAVNSTSDQSTRLNSFNTAIQKLSVDKMSLENDLLRSQIAKINATSTPAMPTAGQRYLIDGQGSTALPGLVETSPMARTASDPSGLHHEPGAITDIGYARTADGGYAPVMSHDVKQRLEEDLPGMLLWNIRNRLFPTVGANSSPPKVPVPEGYDRWMYNPFLLEYRPHRYVNRFGFTRE